MRTRRARSHGPEVLVCLQCRGRFRRKHTMRGKPLFCSAHCRHIGEQLLAGVAPIAHAPHGGTQP